MTDENEVIENEDEVKENEDGNIEIPVLTKDKAKYILEKVEGTVFKVGDAFFSVNYCNVGQRRFSATMINDIKG